MEKVSTSKSIKKSKLPSTSTRRVKPRGTPNPISILNPKEPEVMKQLKLYLDRRFGEKGWVHVPNEMIFLKFLRGVLPKWVFEKIKYTLINFMKSIGVKRDFVDILIFKSHIRREYYSDVVGDFIDHWMHGMAIEVKREKGGKLTEGQREWLEYFDSIGWATAVGHGYDDTIRKIEEVYGNEKR